MTSRLAAGVMVLLAAALSSRPRFPMQREAAAAADAFRLGAPFSGRTPRPGWPRWSGGGRRGRGRWRRCGGGDPATSTRAVRRSVSQVLERSRASGVNLSIRPGAQGVDVTISTRGPVDDILRLAGDLARPDVGVVLSRVHLTRASPRRQRGPRGPRRGAAMRPAVLAFAAAGLLLTWLALDAGRAAIPPPPTPARARPSAGPLRRGAAGAAAPRRLRVRERDSRSAAGAGLRAPRRSRPRKRPRRRRSRR